MTVTHLKNGKILDGGGNMSTPAGTYFIKSQSMYHGYPAFMRQTRQQLESGNPNGIPSSLHISKDLQNGSNGCTRMNCNTATQLGRFMKGQKEAVPVHITPVKATNKFVIRNNKLGFVSGNISETPNDVQMDYSPIEQIKWGGLGELDDHQKTVLKTYARSLIANKQKLQKVLGINSDTYNYLAKASLAILGQESSYGKDKGGNYFRAAGKKLGLNSAPDVNWEYNYFDTEKERMNHSVGLTQIRFNQLGLQERQALKDLQLYHESPENLQSVTHNFMRPETAAMATMVKLATEYKNQGRNLDKALRSWNQDPNYQNAIKSRMNNFKVMVRY